LEATQRWAETEVELSAAVDALKRRESQRNLHRVAQSCGSAELCRVVEGSPCPPVQSLESEVRQEERSRLNHQVALRSEASALESLHANLETQLAADCCDFDNNAAEEYYETCDLVRALRNKSASVVLEMKECCRAKAEVSAKVLQGLRHTENMEKTEVDLLKETEMEAASLQIKQAMDCSTLEAELNTEEAVASQEKQAMEELQQGRETLSLRLSALQNIVAHIEAEDASPSQCTDEEREQKEAFASCKQEIANSQTNIDLQEETYLLESLRCRVERLRNEESSSRKQYDDLRRVVQDLY